MSSTLTLYNVSSKYVPAKKVYTDAKYFSRGLFLTDMDNNIELIAEPSYVHTSGDRYQFSKTAKYVPMRDKINKFIIEHGLTFVLPNLSIVVYDIETYDPCNDHVPMPTSPTSEISLLCAYHKLNGTILSKIVLSLVANKYGPTCADSSDIVVQFIKYVRTCSTSTNTQILLTGFNSSTEAFASKMHHEDDAEVEPIPAFEASCDVGTDAYEAEFAEYTEIISKISFMSNMQSLVKKEHDISEHAKQWTKCGYDLPFMMAKLNTTIDKSYFSLPASAGGRGIDHVDVFGLNVHHVDLRPWLIADSSFDADKPENTKLNGFLAVNKLMLKQNDDLSYEDMRKAMLSPRAFPQIYEKMITYCLYDAESLLLLMDKRMFMDKLQARSKVSKNPLSYILYQTPASNTSLYLCKQLYATNTKFNYEHSKPTDKSFRGAYTYSEYAMATTVSGMWDFAGLYPSNHIATYISPFTLVGAYDTLDEVEAGKAAYVSSPPSANVQYIVLHNNKADDDIYDPNLKNYIVYWKNDADQFIATIQALLAQRKLFKASMAAAKYGSDEARMFNQLQNEVKLMVNTIYGLTGSPFACYWYNPIVSASVTLVGRMAIKLAKDVCSEYGRVLFVDTDSACIQLHQELALPDQNKTSIVAFLDVWAKLEKDINAKFRARLDPTWRIDAYNFQFENVFARIYFPLNKKKCYLKQTFVPSFDKSSYALIFSYKGMQFTERNHQVKNITVDMAERLICGEEKDWNTMLAAFKQVHLDNIRSSPSLYGRRVKLRKTNNIANNILVEFPEFVGETDIMTTCVVRPGRPVAEKWIPIQCVGIETMDANAVFDHSIGFNLGKFFEHVNELKKTQKKQVTLEGAGLLRIRTEPRMQMSTKNFNWLEKVLPVTNHSYHEMITCNHTRAFFDIDMHGTGFPLNEFLEDVALRVGWLKPIVLTAHRYARDTKATNAREAKESFHIIYPVSVHLTFMHEVASLLAIIYPQIDTQVYTLGHTLRLPLCPKYDVKMKTFDQRQFVLLNATVADTLAHIQECCITNLSGTTKLANTGLVFDIIDNIDIRGGGLDIGGTGPNMGLPLEVVTQLTQMYKKFALHSVSSVSNIVRVEPLAKPFHCIICDRQHRSDNGFVVRQKCDSYLISCYRANGVKPGIRVHVKTNTKESQRRDVKEHIDAFIGSLSPLTGKSMQYIEYELDHRLTFIRSGLGTGKTFHLRKLIPNFNVVVIISCRRTLSTVTKANLMEFLDYRDSNASINLVSQPKVIIQIDSLARLRMDAIRHIDLLVLDEVESVLNQLTNSHDSSELIAHFIKTLARSKHIVAMDGCLNTATIEKMSCLIATKSIKVIDNTFQAFAGYEFEVYQCKQGLGDEMGRVLYEIESRLKLGLKIVAPITSRVLAEYIADYIIGKGYRVAIFTGNDIRVANGSSMYKIKQDAFKDINAYIIDTKPDLMIYTTTLTAGVSIDIDWFDEMIGYYSTYINPIDFIQATCRVRKLRKQRGLIFLDITSESAPCTTLEYLRRSYMLDTCLHGGFDMPLVAQLDLWLKARDGTLTTHAWEYVLQSLNSFGYNFKVHPRSETAYSVPIEIDNKPIAKIVAYELTDADILTLLSIEKDEYKTKTALVNPNLEIAALKYKIHTAIRTTLAVTNTLEADMVKKCLQSDVLRKLKRFIRIHATEYNALEPIAKKDAVRRMILPLTDGLCTTPAIVWCVPDSEALVNKATQDKTTCLRDLSSAESLQLTTKVTTSLEYCCTHEHTLKEARSCQQWLIEHQPIEVSTKQVKGFRDNDRAIIATMNKTALAFLIKCRQITNETLRKAIGSQRKMLIPPIKRYEALLSCIGYAELATTSQPIQHNKVRDMMHIIRLPNPADKTVYTPSAARTFVTSVITPIEATALDLFATEDAPPMSKAATAVVHDALATDTKLRIKAKDTSITIADMLATLPTIVPLAVPAKKRVTRAKAAIPFGSTPETEAAWAQLLADDASSHISTTSTVTTASCGSKPRRITQASMLQSKYNSMLKAANPAHAPSAHL